MKKFYKIENGKAQVGSGTIVPDGFSTYESGKEPEELNKALLKEIEKILYDNSSISTNETQMDYEKCRVRS